ncbi:MAG: polysaccharide deacetylase family protein [Planctomycetota bacterium]|nr:polysaccharide deacetylase family protein [Planctomycetota bacterium]
MAPEERSLVEEVKHKQGKYGGFCFGGQEPDGVVVRNPLPTGVVFPNGATAALLLTFDVEGTYGNGVGDMSVEIANYRRICEKLKDNGIAATFNVVGKMAEEQGPEFVEWMLDADCEVAPHGYIHEMYQRYGGEDVYAGHYGPDENIKQVREGVDALNRICPSPVRGFRLPYGHFNEYTYDAFEQAGLVWSSNLGIDDFIAPGLGFGNAPFQMQLGQKVYPVVEIPLDSQTYDWSIWIADEQANTRFVEAVRTYCDLRKIPFDRTPACGVGIWRKRMLDAIAGETVFTLLCHPINLAVRSETWGDPVDEFIFPVIEQLGQFHRDRKAWVCTCGQLADFYWKTMQS